MRQVAQAKMLSIQLQDLLFDQQIRFTQRQQVAWPSMVSLAHDNEPGPPALVDLRRNALHGSEGHLCRMEVVQMNVSRTSLTQHVSATYGKLRDRAAVDGSAANTERFEDFARFSEKFSSSPGQDLSAIISNSKIRGGLKAWGTALVGLTAAIACATAAAWLSGGLAAVALIAAPALAVGGLAGGMEWSSKEKEFAETTEAFGHEIATGRPAGVPSGKPSTRASISADDEWLISPANPASPLSLVAPDLPGNFS